MSLLTRLRLAEPRPPMGEVGDSAQVMTFTAVATGKRLRDLEYLYELTGPNRYRIFDRMRFSDPKVAGLRRAQTLPVVRATVSVEPSDPEDAKSAEIAEFVEDALFTQMSTPWRAWVQNALLYQDYGFAPFEIVWRIDDDSKVRVDRLAYRPPSSIKDIFIDKGSIEHVEQWREDGGINNIPGDKLLWLVNDKEGDNFKGRPLLRPMHKPWYSKEKLEIQLLILVEKMGGMPIITEPSGGLDDETRKKLDTGAANLRIMEKGFMRLPAGVTLDLKAASGSVADVLESIRYFDTQLSNVAQAQVLDLGTTVSGNRALGTTFSDMFSASIEAQTAYIEDVLNGREGLVAKLVEYNFPNSDDFRPAIRFGQVSSVNMLQMAQAFAALAAAGMTLGPEIWEWVREQLGLPEKPDTQVEMPGEPAGAVPPVGGVTPSPSKPPSAQAPKPEGTPADKGAPGTGGAVAAEALHLGWRDPTGLENYCELDELARRFDQAKTAVREQTASTRKTMTRELVRRALEAGKAGKLLDFAQTRPPMLDKLAAQIRVILTDYYDAGRQQVAKELDRQKQGKPVVQDTLEARRQGVKAADKPKVTGKAKSLTPNEAQSYIVEQSQVLARSIGSGSVAAASNEAARAVVVSVAESVMEDMVMRQSDAAAMQAGLTVTRMMNIGRGTEAKQQGSRVGAAYYSAVLDENVCTACSMMDGEHTTNLDEADNWTPNPDCEGGDRCRCFTIYEEA